jgi:stage II sporulation protein D
VAGFPPGDGTTCTMRRRITLAIVVTLAASVILSGGGATATASPSFTFYGSGYGHGIGMSQWGAFGLAQMGWEHADILTHFFQGTDVGPTTPLPKRIRVGLTAERKNIHLTAKAGPVRLWLDTPLTGTSVGTIPSGSTWTVHTKGRAYAIRDAAGALVGGHRWGGAAHDLFATYADAGSRVFVPEADAIWGNGFTYSRGYLEFNLYRCGQTDGCDERLILPLSLEEYLYGLGEVPASWPMEAMEAQADAARTYAVYAMRHTGIRADCNCHLTDGSNDQTYIGYNRESGTDGDRWVAAVDASKGEVITYKGAVIQSFYAASDGGHSENVEDVWHGGNPAYAVPWLKGVCDPGESTTSNPYTDWTRTYSSADVTSRLLVYTRSIGTVTAFTNVERGVSGRIVTLKVAGTSGSAQVSGSELRAALGLYDDRVWINQDRNVLGSIREKYDSLMCAPGLPESKQRTVPDGAQQFFAKGGLFRNSADALTVWLKGPIYDEYRAVGAGKGVLGVPTSSMLSITSCTGCRRVDFVGGRVYLEPDLGAHALWGPVLTAYLDNGGSVGSLGFPMTRTRAIAAGGTKARFEHGLITCPDGQVCTITAS